jgi:SAM-dependent methyltransferase
MRDAKSRNTGLEKLTLKDGDTVLEFEEVYSSESSSTQRDRGTMKTAKPESKPSLESLIESEDIGLEVLHPGGLDTTRELAELCTIRTATSVLDVACGTGESACYLVESFGARVVGIDSSDYMVERARRKAQERKLTIELRKGDAHNLPFADDRFDVVISECTTCLLQKQKAIAEAVRVTKPGGRVGIHDICWKEDTPEHLKQRLAQLEGENPETLEGWKQLFETAGLVNIQTVESPTSFINGRRRSGSDWA